MGERTVPLPDELPGLQQMRSALEKLLAEVVKRGRGRYTSADPRHEG